jgi:hypothetical protein
MDFKLSEGPWKQLFSGVYEEYDLEIYSNPESLILVSILEKDGDKIKGAVIEIFKVFHAVGELHGFVETLPREVLTISKHNEKETVQFFILGSKAGYANYSQDSFSDEVDEMIKKINASTTLLGDVSKAYDLKLQELHTCPEPLKQAFYSQPLMVPLLSSALHKPGAKSTEPDSSKTVGQVEDIITSAFGGKIEFGELLLGITKEGTQVKEPLTLFGSTIVENGSQGERAHALHLLAESALLSNLPTVIIDWDNSFEGLGTKTSKTDELGKYKVDIVPIGFPVKEFSVPTQVKVDLTGVNGAALMQAFGIEESIAGKEIAKILELQMSKSLENVAVKVKDLPTGGEFNAFQRNRARRILKLIDLRYPELFKGPNNIKEISRGWMKGIGRAGIISMRNQDDRASVMVVNSLIKGLLNKYREQGGAKQLRGLLIIPQAKRLIPRTAEDRFVKELVAGLVELQKFGIGFALGVERSIDLPAEIIKTSTTRIGIVKGNDVGIQMKDRKNYRILLRPGLSKCSELGIGKLLH